MTVSLLSGQTRCAGLVFNLKSAISPRRFGYFYWEMASGGHNLGARVLITTGLVIASRPLNTPFQKLFILEKEKNRLWVPIGIPLQYKRILCNLINLASVYPFFFLARSTGSQWRQLKFWFVLSYNGLEITTQASVSKWQYQHQQQQYKYWKEFMWFFLTGLFILQVFPLGK